MIYEFGTEQVNQKLCEKEESGYQSNVVGGRRNMVVTVKFQKALKFAVIACVIKPKYNRQVLSYGSQLFIEFPNLKS